MLGSQPQDRQNWATAKNVKSKVLDITRAFLILILHQEIVSLLPGGHLPPPKFGHLPPPNSDISHPQKKKHLPGGQLPPPFFFSFFWRTFLGFFDLQLMEDIKDGKDEVLDEVVMEHIK